MGSTQFLDNGTLAVVFSVGTLTLSLFLLVLRVTTPRYKGLIRCALGNVTLGLGFAAAYAFRGGNPWLGIVLPNSLIILGVAFVGNGTWRFLEKPRRWTPAAYLPPVVIVPILAHFTFIQPSVYMRIVAMSLFLSAQFTASAFALLVNFPHRRKAAARFTGTVYLALTVLFLVRIPFSRNELVPSIVSSSPAKYVVLIMMIIGALSWTFSLVLMTASRLAEEVAAHELEAGLRERDRLVKTIIDTLPQSIVLKDKDSRYLACNGAFAKTLGKTPEELVGSSDADHKPANAVRNRATDLAVMRSGESWESFERADSNGKERWVDTIRTPVRDENGEVKGVLTVFRDVTDRVLSERALQDSERRYRELSGELERRVERRTAELQEAKRDIDLFFEVTVEYLCIFDFEGRFLKLSPSWTKQLGWRGEELAGRPLIDLVHPDDRETTVRASAEFVQGDKVVSFQNRVRKADGGWIWLSWASVGVPDRALVIAAAHDVTVRMQTEERLNAAREEAERASRSKSQFISTMSHELRTPLNAVLGYGKLLEGIVEDERGLAYLRSIGSAGRSLLAIINDLLDLTKAESGRIELTPIPADPRHILDELAEIFRFGAEEKDLALEFRATARLPKTVLMDAPRLRQVLINLVGNAVKFTEEGAVVVSMDAVDEDASPPRDDPRATWKATIKIEVSDTGIGIDEGYRAHLFESFSQQDAEIAHRYGGTGLGLAIAKRLLDLMGGTIRCEAGEAGGTRFFIEIPGVTVAGSASETITFIGGPTPSDADPQRRVKGAGPGTMEELEPKLLRGKPVPPSAVSST